MRCNCQTCCHYDGLARQGIISRKDAELTKKNAHKFKERLRKQMDEHIAKVLEQRTIKRAINTEDDGSYDEYQDNQISKKP